VAADVLSALASALDGDHAGLAAVAHAIREWGKANVGGGVLNVAGPRASKHPIVYETARSPVRAVLAGRGS
jgi:hypothetical protein